MARDAEHLALLRRLKLRAYVVVPILAKGTLLGTIALVTAESNRRYSESDVAVAEDLARRAAMAVENARLYAEARRAVHVREQVLATVSHDLRNQVNVVAIASELLLRTTNMQDTASAKPLTVIARTTKSMRDLVNDLLDLASIQAGKLSLSVVPTPLASLIEDAREAHEPAARAAGLRLTAEEIPQIDVLADRSRVLQVLSNLIGNAIKFTPSGGIVAIRADASDCQVTVSVSDTGRGIPGEDVVTLFEPYRARGSGAGSGLGLFIARGIVERHDGRIWIDSREHVGTTVSFTLPRQQSTPAGE
jgi:signal transduction histidine kinase